ncbi:MAG: lysozyme [Bacteroides sp.]|nr:lysozyme [Bacteroides sp.]
MRIIGKKGIDLIKHFEGFQPKPYLCPAGKWTIGYGTTDGVSRDSKPVSKEEAEMLLRSDMMTIEEDLNRMLPESLDLTQDQFDAVCSFCYNLGTSAFQQSTLKNVILRNPHDHDHIRKEFARWVYVNKRQMKGLVARRKAEADLYCDGTEVC